MSHTTLDAREMALDPALHPELYDGVRSRRIFAFLIDAAIILVLMILATLVVTLVGIVTLGLGWLLYPLIWPVVAIIYTMFTLGGPHSATPGMRFCGIEIRMLSGDKLYPLMALAHSALFWISVSFLTPLILLVALVTRRKQTLHDLVIGTIAVRSSFLR